jgi:hypothetical protein
MGYLQLAENDPYSHLAEVGPDAMKFYVYIPEGYRGATKDMYIREDVLDDLPAATYAQIMSELAPYQNTGLSASKEERAAQRAERKAGREERKNTRATAGKTRQEARTERQRLRSEAKGKGSGAFAGILGSITGAATDIFGKGNVDVNAGGGDFSVDYSSQPEETFFSRYKIPIILGSVAVIGGGIYLLTRKK